jgi:hypothetical protein
VTAGVETDPASSTDWSIHRWCQQQVGRRDARGRFAKWILAGCPGPDPPLGYSRARAEYDRWVLEQQRTPAARSAIERLRMETAAARPLKESPPPPIVGVDVLPALMEAIEDLHEVVNQLVLWVIPEDRQGRVRRSLAQVSDRIARLKGGLDADSSGR